MKQKTASELAEEYVASCAALEFIYEDKMQMSYEDQELRPSSILGNIKLGYLAGFAEAEKRANDDLKELIRIADGLLIHLEWAERCGAFKGADILAVRNTAGNYIRQAKKYRQGASE